MRMFPLVSVPFLLLLESTYWRSVNQQYDRLAKRSFSHSYRDFMYRIGRNFEISMREIGRKSLGLERDVPLNCSGF